MFFAPAYTAPLGLQVPLALTIHDVSFLAHPGMVPAARADPAPVADRGARREPPPWCSPTRLFSRDEILRHIPLDPGPDRR